VLTTVPSPLNVIVAHYRAARFATYYRVHPANATHCALIAGSAIWWRHKCRK